MLLLAYLLLVVVVVDNLVVVVICLLSLMLLLFQMNVVPHVLVAYLYSASWMSLSYESNDLMMSRDGDESIRVSPRVPFTGFCSPCDKHKRLSFSFVCGDAGTKIRIRFVNGSW